MSLEVDLHQPLASLLKDATAKPHDDVAKSEKASWLTEAQLDKEEYVRFLMMLYYIYE